MTSGRIGEAPKLSLWQRLKRVALTDVGALVRGMNAADLEALERTLIEADFGVQATVELVQALEDEVRRGQLKTEDDLRQAVLSAPGRRSSRCRGASPGGWPARADGVDGDPLRRRERRGQDHHVAKLARRLQREGRKVLLAAADTYRAGAIPQLQVWAERLGLPCVAGRPGGDPAAVAFDAIEAAAEPGRDTVLIDTAGRLHTQEGLMEELRKVVRVIARKRPGRAARDAAGARRHGGPERDPAGPALRPGGAADRHHRHQARRQRPGRRRGGAPQGARPADPVPRAG